MEEAADGESVEEAALRRAAERAERKLKMAGAARNGGRAVSAAEEYVDNTPRELPAFPPTWVNPEIWHPNGAGRLGDQFGETCFDLDPKRRVRFTWPLSRCNGV